MSDRDDIDRLLRESGERWRSTPLPLPTVNEAMFREHPAAGSASTRWLPAVAGLAILALVAAVALRTALADPTRPGVGLPPTPATSTSSPPPETSLPPSAAPTTASPLPESTATPGPTASASQLRSNDPLTDFPAIVRDGDPVVAYGHIFESEPGGLLCQLVMAGAPATPPECAFEPLVPVTGVDVRELGAKSAGRWVTDYVRVDGVWNDGAIAVSRVRPADRPSPASLLFSMFPTSREIPCETPPGGWPDPPEGDWSIQPLQSEVDGHPEKYVGLWNGVATDSDGRQIDLVVVVGAVGDVDSVAGELRSIYPFNLCVTHAQYSSRELQEVADSLSAMFPDWQVYVAPSISRVSVRLAVFDSRAAEATRPYEGKVVVVPVVRLADG